MTGRPWYTIGLAVSATVAVTAVINAQFIWVNLKQYFAPPISLESDVKVETATVRAQEQVRYLPNTLSASPKDKATLPIKAIGISNANLLKISVGLNSLSGNDSDNDGLPNKLEEALGTDPHQADTDKDGFTDFQELRVNRNPLGKGNLPISLSFTNKLKGKYLIQVQGLGQLWYVNPADGKRYYIPYPEMVSNFEATISQLATSPQDSANWSIPKLEPDELYIESLGIDVPVIYVSDTSEESFQAGLVNGVVHYPGTANPGEFGNVYIFGHSSDYRWSNGKFKTIFATLPQIKLGSVIVISDNKGKIYQYKVFEAKVVSATDTQYLGQYDNERRLLTLQTSWPVGTALKRYVVLAEMVAG